MDAIETEAVRALERENQELINRRSRFVAAMLKAHDCPPDWLLTSNLADGTAFAEPPAAGPSPPAPKPPERPIDAPPPPPAPT